MTSTFSKAFGLSALALIAVATGAGAATPVPAAPVLSQGPVIPGVCEMSVPQVIGQSMVGAYIRTRLDQIVTQVRAELNPEDAAIATDAKALESQRAALDAATLQSRGQALQARFNALNEKKDLRQRELKATQDKAENRVLQELDPIAQQIYQAHHCSILIDRGSVMLSNPDMDLTAAAITALNGKIQQFPFDREHLDTGAAAPGK